MVPDCLWQKKIRRPGRRAGAFAIGRHCASKAEVFCDLPQSNYFGRPHSFSSDMSARSCNVPARKAQKTPGFPDVQCSPKAEVGGSNLFGCANNLNDCRDYQAVQ